MFCFDQDNGRANFTAPKNWADEQSEIKDINFGSFLGCPTFFGTPCPGRNHIVSKAAESHAGIHAEDPAELGLGVPLRAAAGR